MSQKSSSSATFPEFERCQSIHEGLPLGSGNGHLGSIGGVQVNIIEVIRHGRNQPTQFWDDLLVISTYEYLVWSHDPRQSH